MFSNSKIDFYVSPVVKTFVRCATFLDFLGIIATRRHS